jgi:endonuclease G
MLGVISSAGNGAGMVSLNERPTLMHCQRSRLLSIAVVLPLFAAAACLDGYPPDGDPATGETVEAVTTNEGFEAATKTAYAAADVTLGSGTWNLNDALIGTLSTDVKTGAQSARIRNSGHVTMGFDRTTGAGTVTLHHASFSADASGTWALFS